MGSGKEFRPGGRMEGKQQGFVYSKNRTTKRYTGSKNKRAIFEQVYAASKPTTVYKESPERDAQDVYKSSIVGESPGVYRCPVYNSSSTITQEQHISESRHSVDNQSYNIAPAWNIDISFVKKLFSVNFFPKNFFKIFHTIPYHSIKVVIIGQSPYPDPRHACGIAFQVPDDVIICPVSLKTLFKELESDIGIPKLRIRDCIKYWVSQGIFLTNASLTIGTGEPEYLRNHKYFWQDFSIEFIKRVSILKCPIILLGKDSWELEKYITHNKYLKFYHPASRDNQFDGCKMFSKINNLLDTPFDWLCRSA
ncbi:hypothetical protein HK099_000280 [Clydaea vesicula]|uniref:Uracil-DNA glycosylase-like domain-containing protein n=1 Tax=Clydaea vesicula TaxID=447962 RepID=A0AAD5U5R6_9FUNG|nr:hypothetical protein HK099_000280 [Clydaea vesicula]